MKNFRHIIHIFSLLLLAMTACVKEDPATIEFASAEYNLLVGENHRLPTVLRVLLVEGDPSACVCREVHGVVD